ncbi:hypothetical protein DFH11DRAFT_1576484, partial [Phellopilus nigrolimitatus]
MGVVSGQFSQMGLAGGPKPHALYTANVLMAPPDPRELYAPPPEMCLLSNACISPILPALYDQRSSDDLRAAQLGL